MIIHNIKITDFKSCYGSHYFDFDKMKGLIKLSGPIGSGKTTIGEALLWGLFGTVKGQNNGQLIAWNTKACEIELNITCFILLQNISVDVMYTLHSCVLLLK